VDLMEYLRIAVRRWPLLLVGLLLGGLAGLFAPQSKPAPPTFKAVSTLVPQIVSSSSNSSVSVSPPTIALLVTSGDVADKVAKQIGFTGPSDLLTTGVSTVADSRTQNVSITVSDRHGVRALALANAFATQTNVVLASQVTAQRQVSVDSLSSQLNGLSGRIKALSSQIATTPTGQGDLLIAQRDALLHQYSAVFAQLQQFELDNTQGSGYQVIPAGSSVFSSTVTSSTTKLLNRRAVRGPLGAVLGLLVAIGLALVLERVDTRIRTKEAAEAAFGLPVVAEVPLDKRRRRRRLGPLVTRRAPLSQTAEGYRMLGTALLLMPSNAVAPPGSLEPATGNGSGNGNGSGPGHGDNRALLSDGQAGPRVIMITSAGPDEGKTMTAANLAVCLAETGRSTVVVDSNFRRPAVHAYLGAPLSPGLADLATRSAGEARLDSVLQPTEVPGVQVVPTGPPVLNPTELVVLERRLLPQARDLADAIVLDAPPLLLANDALQLIPAVDSVVVVCRVGQTRALSARRATELLSRVGVPVLGVVLFGTRPVKARKYHSAQGVAKAAPARPPAPAAPAPSWSPETVVTGPEAETWQNEPADQPL
jgi:capsular exopolysaccharide synthesis family protein